MVKILSKREKLILYLTIGVFISAVAFNFIVSPILNKNDKLNKEIRVGEAKLKKYHWLLKQKDDIQSRYSRLSSGLNVTGKGEDSLVGVLADLEDLAQKANIRIIFFYNKFFIIINCFIFSVIHSYYSYGLG